MNNPLALFKEGILESDWDKIKKAYQALTGETISNNKNKRKKTVKKQEQLFENRFVDDKTEGLEELKQDQKWFKKIKKGGVKKTYRDEIRFVDAVCERCHKHEIVNELLVKRIVGGEQASYLCNQCCSRASNATQ